MPILHPAGSTPSMVSFDSGVDQYDDQLTTLMEDFVRATQLQISLKKRIDVVMSQRENAARAQEEEARMQWEEAQEKRQQLVEANRLLRLKMEETESAGNPPRERDTEEDAGRDDQVVEIPPITADSGVIDGNLQNSEPTIQIPTTPLHHSPKQTSALIATPRSAAMSDFDRLAPVEDESNDIVAGREPIDSDWFRDEVPQEMPQSEEDFGVPAECVTPPPASGSSFRATAQPPKAGDVSAFWASMYKNPPPSNPSWFKIATAAAANVSKLDTRDASPRPLAGTLDTLGSAKKKSKGAKKKTGGVGVFE